MFKREDFEKIVDRRIDVITTEALFRAWSNKAQYAELGQDLHLSKSFVLLSEYFVSNEDLNHIKQLALGFGPAQFGLAFCKVGEKNGEEALEYSARIKRQNFASTSTQELLATLKKFDEKALKLLAFTSPTHPIALVIENQLREIVAKHESNPAKRDELISTLTFPTRENTPVIENRELMKIASEITKLSPVPSSPSALPSKLKSKLGHHVEKFGFLGARGAGLKCWSVQDLFGRLVEMCREPNLKEKIKKSEKEASSNKTETQAIAKKLKFSQEETALVEAAKEIVYFRTYRTEVMYHIYSDVDNLLTEIAKRFGYSLQQVKSMTTNEILNLGNAEVDVKLLKEREKFFAITCDSRIEIFAGNSLEKVKHLMLEQKLNVSELKGTIACKGKVSGFAKVVLTAAELSKVTQGDVLVTIMTTPDFVPAMQRAAAFVTNEGGITCHAAIIARELNKPCIIGTKTATKAFQDGDLLEVDADKGTVKVLKKATAK